LIGEAGEMLAIFSKSQKTAKENRQHERDMNRSNRPIVQ
jgi:hypothetical protein